MVDDHRGQHRVSSLRRRYAKLHMRRVAVAAWIAELLMVLVAEPTSPATPRRPISCVEGHRARLRSTASAAAALQAGSIPASTTPMPRCWATSTRSTRDRVVPAEWSRRRPRGRCRPCLDPHPRPPARSWSQIVGYGQVAESATRADPTKRRQATVTVRGGLTMSDDGRRPRPRDQASAPGRTRGPGPRWHGRHDRRRLHRHAGPADGQTRPRPGVPRRRHRARGALLHVPPRDGHGDEHARGVPAHELGDRLRRLDRRADLGPAAVAAVVARHGHGPRGHHRRGDGQGDPGFAPHHPQAPGRRRRRRPASTSRPAPNSNSTS